MRLKCQVYNTKNITIKIPLVFLVFQLRAQQRIFICMNHDIRYFKLKKGYIALINQFKKQFPPYTLYIENVEREKSTTWKFIASSILFVYTKSHNP